MICMSSRLEPVVEDSVELGLGYILEEAATLTAWKGMGVLFGTLLAANLVAGKLLSLKFRESYLLINLRSNLRVCDNVAGE